MKRLMIMSVIALVALAGPLGTRLKADDAHHPEKSAKAKKSTATKPKPKPKQQKKKPPAETNKTSRQDNWPGARSAATPEGH